MRYKIAVLGLWHLGETYAAGLAELGHHVVGFDEGRATVDGLSRGVPPLAEPGLAALIARHSRAGRLSFERMAEETLAKIVPHCNVVWITYDTPVNGRDESDVGPIMRAVRRAAPHLREDVLFVVSSQVPAGTSSEIVRRIKKERPRLKFHYVYSPENLRLGEALQCFLHPGRVVVGAADDEGFRRMNEIFRRAKTEVIRMSPASAEMAKHALNAFLATSISFANDIADACERTGADVAEVMKALRSDPRVGVRAALGAGLGFSGGTLGRDLVSLLRLGGENGRENGPDLPVIRSALAKNAARPARLVARLSALLGGGLKGKRVALFGLTYKAGTTTLRRSRSLEVARLLARQGAEAVLCDPHVPEADVPRFAGARTESRPYAAAKGAHALLFLTPWPDFKALDFRRLAKAARRRAAVLDAYNSLLGEETAIKKSGFQYQGIGR